MQYTRPPQFRQIPQNAACAAARVSLRCAFMAAFVLAACLFVTLAFPASAHAKSYTMPQVDIKAQMETDGTLHVVEQRTFDFDGSYSAVWWTLNLLPSNAEFAVNGVRMMAVDGESATESSMSQVSEVPFQLKWREEGGPGVDAYSVDSPKNTVYVFFGNAPKRIVVELDYTITNMAQVYDDVAEVYWQYLGSQWSAPSENVTATLQLPLPQGTTVEPGENVRAWGHGPLEGVVSVNQDGSVTCTVPRVESGEYAEMRVLVPTSWLSNVSLKTLRLHAGEQRLDTVLKEEQSWADQANTRRMMSFAYVAGCALVCLLVLAWALWAFFRYGKEYTPRFTDKYWREVPDKGIHPAVIGRLWRWNRESTDDFTTTIMHMVQTGLVRIDAGSYEAPAKHGGTQLVNDFYVTKLVDASEVVDPVDKATFKLLFERIAGGQNAVWFGSIKKYGEDHPNAFVKALENWQDVLTKETDAHEFFEARGARLRKVMWVLAAVFAVIGLMVWLNDSNMLNLLFTLPTAAALAFLGNNMPRRSVEGNELVAHCKALRNWLRDFSSLDERPPTDVKVWGEFMVYAYLFGVAEKAIEQLRLTQPQLFGVDDSYGATYVPWWAWYTAPESGVGAQMPDVGSFLSSSLDAATKTAHEAIQAASGSSSSGSGFGGGFSSGGGGGFGGGGGGAR